MLVSEFVCAMTASIHTHSLSSGHIQHGQHLAAASKKHLSSVSHLIHSPFLTTYTPHRPSPRSQELSPTRRAVVSPSSTGSLFLPVFSFSLPLSNRFAFGRSGTRNNGHPHTGYRLDRPRNGPNDLEHSAVACSVLYKKYTLRFW